MKLYLSNVYELTRTIVRLNEWNRFCGIEVVKDPWIKALPDIFLKNQ